MSDGGFTLPIEEATQTLGLSPQEQYLYWTHLNNLHGEGKIEHPDGSISTLYQAVTSGPDGAYYNIPTVWDVKIVPMSEARERVNQLGWGKFPSYATPEQADLRYHQMHQFMDKDVGAYKWLKSVVK